MTLRKQIHPVTIAAFDLDDTLLNGDSVRKWGLFLVQQGLLDADLHRRRSAEFWRDYQAGRLDAEASAAFDVAPLVGMDSDSLAELGERFGEQCLRPMIEPPAVELLQRHRDRGDKLVVITSTNTFIAGIAARLLQVQEVLGTQLEWRNGRITGKVLPPACYREGKIVHLSRWAQEQNKEMKEAYFYSDSSNDLPLLREVAHPVAVNPDAELRAEAERRSWPILQFFDN